MARYRLPRCHRLYNQRRHYFVPIFLSLFLLFFSSSNAQFGEIASVISSLVSNGGGAGLAGLGAAGSGASLGASAGTGAANAFGSIGTLYQLAQAALQLTGTGVGIANQASESSWFPVAVEHATKMNRDFQERLLHGLGSGGAESRGALLSGRGSTKMTEVGTEYGKEFGSNEDGNSISTNAKGPESSATFSSGVSLLPSLFPVGQGSLETTALPPFGFRPLPGLARLLPGEATGDGNTQEILGLGSRGGSKWPETGALTTTDKKLVGIGTIEEVPLNPNPLSLPHEEHGVGNGGGEFVPSALLPGEVAVPSPPVDTSAISSPKIRIELPESAEKTNSRTGEKEAKKSVVLPDLVEKKGAIIEQIDTEFSTDNEGGGETAGNGPGTEVEEEDANLEPLIPSASIADRLNKLNMSHIEQMDGHPGLAQMVPELSKLIGHLKMGNLSSIDLVDLERQLLDINGSSPRENERRKGEENSSALIENDGGQVSGEERERAGHRRPVSESHQRATERNLEAFHRGLESSSVEEQKDRTVEDKDGDELEPVDGQKDPILRKIIDFNKPPVIFSLERSSVSERRAYQPIQRPFPMKLGSDDHQHHHRHFLRIEGNLDADAETLEQKEKAAGENDKKNPSQLGGQKEETTTFSTTTPTITNTMRAITMAAKITKPQRHGKGEGQNQRRQRQGSPSSGKQKQTVQNRRQSAVPILSTGPLRVVDRETTRTVVKPQAQSTGQRSVSRGVEPSAAQKRALGQKTGVLRQYNHQLQQEQIGAQWRSQQFQQINHWNNFASNQQQPNRQYQQQQQGEQANLQRQQGYLPYIQQNNVQQNPNNNNLLQQSQQQKNWVPPVRTISSNVQTTPPSLVYHPYSTGTLLTLSQSQQLQPEFFRFGGR